MPKLAAENYVGPTNCKNWYLLLKNTMHTVYKYSHLFNQISNYKVCIIYYREKEIWRLIGCVLTKEQKDNT